MLFLKQLSKRKKQRRKKHHLSRNGNDATEDSNIHDDINLIINIQNILSLVNSMNCPKCNLHASYNYEITKRLGLS